MYEKVEAASGATVRQKLKLQFGIPQDKAKEIVRIIKDTKLKLPDTDTGGSVEGQRQRQRRPPVHYPASEG